MSEHTNPETESENTDAAGHANPHDDPPRETVDDVWSRRSVVRYLAPISVAVPVIIEGRTLVGLLEQDLADDGESSWSKPTGVDVGVGGALRPDAPIRAKLSNAVLADTSDGRRLTLAVAVKNPTNAPARFAIGAVGTTGGTVDGGTTTDPLPPGTSTTFQTSYDLPSDATPETVETVVVVANDESKKTVQLAPIPPANTNG